MTRPFAESTSHFNGPRAGTRDLASSTPCSELSAAGGAPPGGGRAIITTGSQSARAAASFACDTNRCRVAVTKSIFWNADSVGARGPVLRRDLPRYRPTSDDGHANNCQRDTPWRRAPSPPRSGPASQNPPGSRRSHAPHRPRNLVPFPASADPPRKRAIQRHHFPIERWGRAAAYPARVWLRIATIDPESGRRGGASTRWR